jgi:hypothetical protein
MQGLDIRIFGGSGDIKEGVHGTRDRGSGE